MKRFFRAWREEYRIILSDPGALLIFVGAIVFYSIVYPIPYLPQVLKDVPVVAVDLDHSALSRRLIRMADANEFVSVAQRASSIAEAEEHVRAGRAGGALVIPRGFQKKIQRGGQVTVGAYCDAGYLLVYRQVLSGLYHAVGTLSAGVEIRRLRAGGASVEQALSARDPLPLSARALFNPSWGYATYVVPPVLVLILQQTLLIGIGLLHGTARERRAGSDAREIDAGREHVLPVLLGRSAAYLALYLVHSIYFFGVLCRLYRFPHRGDGAALLLFMLPFLLSVTLLGLALSAFFRRRETAIQTLLFTSIPAIFLSGFAWPPEAIPAWLRFLSFFLPSTAGIAGFLRVQQMGASLQEVRFEWLVLWGLCAVYFVLAWVSLRRQASFSPEVHGVLKPHQPFRSM